MAVKGSIQGRKRNRVQLNKPADLRTFNQGPIRDFRDAAYVGQICTGWFLPVFASTVNNEETQA